MIKGAKIVSLEAAHLSNIEQPKAYTDAVLNFLTALIGRHAMDDSERLKRGEAARRSVLGDEWVDRSARTATRSTPSGSTPSPAAPGATSGRGRISTTARGACW